MILVATYLVYTVLFRMSCFRFWKLLRQDEEWGKFLGEEVLRSV